MSVYQPVLLDSEPIASTIYEQPDFGDLVPVEKPLVAGMEFWMQDWGTATRYRYVWRRWHVLEVLFAGDQLAIARDAEPDRPELTGALHVLAHAVQHEPKNSALEAVVPHVNWKPTGGEQP